MIKYADTVQPDVLEVIRKRYSPRAFSSQSISDDTLRTILEAAAWAPSSRNEQPWRFIIARRGDARFESALAAINEKNREWAKAAPLIGYLVGKTKFDHKNYPNGNYAYDCGAAMAFLSLQAVAHDVFIHQMAGIDPAEAARTFNVPDDYEVLVGFAAGYIGDPDQLNENYKAGELKPRTRKPLSEIVFGTGWGEAADFLEQ